MKNINLSANEALLEAAQLRAASERTTLNKQVRQWIRMYARHEQRKKTSTETIAEPGKRLHTQARRYSRKEVNEC